MRLAELYSGQDDWLRTRIDALATPVRQLIDPAKLDGQDVFHISIPAFDEFGDGQIQSSELIGSQKLRLHGGEVLLAKLNPRKSRVALVLPQPVPILASGEFIALEPGPSCDPRFLVWLLRSQMVRQWLDSQVRSVTRSHQRVDPQALTQAQIWVPPIHKQRYISKFLDDRIAKLDELICLKEKLSAQLLERLSAAMHTAIARLPRDAKLAYAGSWFSGGTPPKDERKHWSGPMPWASTKDLTTDELHETLDHVTSEAALTYSRVVPKGSLLVATRGMALAKRLPLAVTRCPIAFNQDLKAIVPVPGIDADYLRIVVRGYQSELLGAVVESAHGTRRLETRHLKALRVPIPSPDAQRRIVKQVHKVEVENQTVAKALRLQMDLLQERRDTLITAAVTGELDPSSYRASAVTI